MRNIDLKTLDCSILSHKDSYRSSRVTGRVVTEAGGGLKLQSMEYNENLMEKVREKERDIINL